MAARVANKDNLAQAICEQVSGSYTSTDNTLTVVSGSAMDIRGYPMASYLMWSTTNVMKVTVFVANLSDFSDEKVISAATAVTPASTVFHWTGAVSLNSTTTQIMFMVPFGFVRLKAEPNVADTHGTINFTGLAKSI